MSRKSHFLLWMLIAFAIVCLFLISREVRGQALEIKSGVVIDETEKKIDVGPGTYIPEPANKELAKRIVDLNTSVETLTEKFIDANEKISILTANTVNMEKSYQNKIDNLEIENAMLRGFWSRWGKTLVWCAVSAGAGFLVGYEINKLLEK